MPAANCVPSQALQGVHDEGRLELRPLGAVALAEWRLPGRGQRVFSLAVKGAAALGDGVGTSTTGVVLHQALGLLLARRGDDDGDGGAEAALALEVACPSAALLAPLSAAQHAHGALMSTLCVAVPASEGVEPFLEGLLHCLPPRVACLRLWWFGSGAQLGALVRGAPPRALRVVVVDRGRRVAGRREEAELRAACAARSPVLQLEVVL